MIIITGSEGYIGSTLKPHFPNAFLYDKTLVNNYLPNYQFSSMEIRTVYHLADTRLTEYTENDLIEQNLLIKEIIALKPNKIVYASSCSVYGRNDEKVDEHGPTIESSLYSYNKLNIEKQIINSGIDFSILRFGTCFGVGNIARNDTFINYIISNAVQNNPIELYDLDSLRPYIHITDFVNALKYFSTFKNLLVNVAAFNLTKKQIINEVQKHINIKYTEIKRDEIRNYQVDNSYSKRLGFQYNMKFKESIEETVRNYGIFCKPSS